MIQFNLLPDVKLEYIKAQHTKQLVTSICFLAGAVSIGVLIVLVLTVDVWQHKTINDLSGDIKTTSAQLKATPDLNKILTIQNQLGALDGLHNDKAAAARLFSYLSQVTPTNVTISDLKVDYTADTMTISGDAPTLDAVNTFTDSLKFTKYQVDGSTDSTLAFSKVVLSSFGRSSTGATYSIDLSFDPVIFDNTQSVKLLVPNIVTTRSIIEQPTELFKNTSK